MRHNFDKLQLDIIKGAGRPPDVVVAMMCVILKMSDEEVLELHHSE